MNLEDVRLLDDLQSMWELLDPPPADLADLMIAAVAAADLDWPMAWELELLTLTYDSAREDAPAIRGLATARTLTFGHDNGPTLDVEFDGTSVNGQVLGLAGDAGAVEVVLETTSGSSWSTVADEFGFFTLEAPGIAGRGVSARFTLVVGGQRIATEWIAL